MNHSSSLMRQTTASSLVTKQRLHWISIPVAVIAFGHFAITKSFLVDMSRDEIGWTFWIGLAALITAIFTTKEN